jgi:hypothetical protein
MPWPRSGTYGIIDNPMVFSPYTEGNTPGEGDFITLFFLLLNGNVLDLLSGGFLLLL